MLRKRMHAIFHLSNLSHHRIWSWLLLGLITRIRRKDSRTTSLFKMPRILAPVLVLKSDGDFSTDVYQTQSWSRTLMSWKGEFCQKTLAELRSHRRNGDMENHISSFFKAIIISSLELCAVYCRTHLVYRFLITAVQGSRINDPLILASGS